MSLPLDRWTVSLDAEGRMKRIDAELKEKLSPYGATRSERFRFAYDLAFSVICGDHTNQIVRALLLAWQDSLGMKSSQVPAEVPIAGKKGTVKSPAVPLPIKGFQGGSAWVAH